MFSTLTLALIRINKIHLMGAVKMHRRPRSPASALASLGFTTSERVSTFKEAIQVHHHNESCKKKDCTGTDISCRFQMPRPINKTSYMYFANGGTSFLMQRDVGGMCVYLWPFMLAVPCNQMMGLTSDGMQDGVCST
jgi:hypothetical protein